ncbi:MAG: hypothetical protein NTU47_04320 [Ignavibacteriales bacterium]|nr:hypothetical protein [Ignavibacteriales bacterium]
MNQITSCQSKAISLNQILTSSFIQLPVYTRFQKTDLYLTVPVTSIEVSNSGITVHTSNGAPSQIAWDELLDIVTFVDGNGKPVFLAEISNGSDIAATIFSELEENSDQMLLIRFKHQHEYMSEDDAREAWWEARRMASRKRAYRFALAA